MSIGGCAKGKDKMGRHVVNLLGQRFGKLVVIDIETTIPKVRWVCVCDCGNIKCVDSGNLKKGQVKSCGCLVKENKGQFRDLLGQKFNRLLVTKFSHVDAKGCYNWMCVCDCGEILVVRGDSLTTGNTKSCGCLKTERIHESKNSRESNGNWKEGITIEYPIEWNNYLRELIRDRDNRTCQFPACDYSDGFGKEKLSVHHIDGNKNYCHSSNLISLCRSHHSYIENNNPKSWMGYFYSIAYDYEYKKEENSVR